MRVIKKMRIEELSNGVDGREPAGDEASHDDLVFTSRFDEAPDKAFVG